MTSTNTTKPTMLDDLKDQMWVTQERISTALDFMSGRDVDVDPEMWAFDEIRKSAIDALAKHLPGLSYGDSGLPLYANEEVFKATRTYDDGTPLVEHFTFPDVPGYTFTYRPRHDKPRAEFMAWARNAADLYKADTHANYVSAGGLGIEHRGILGQEFHATIHNDDDSAWTILDLAQLKELRDGIERILFTEARYRFEEQSETKWTPTERSVEAESFTTDGLVILRPDSVGGATVLQISVHSGEDTRCLLSPKEARELARCLAVFAEEADYEGSCISKE
ncbi:hypothetical protein G7068_03180 [Leucobacter viscericola]|uniref:Uncharacterized protein n=1 Tax=Leucobacter viscericola TaxID=2714935 RepID=A0A6G7XD35_9MICO|nr:hypothetical protein [Leucobacter viscericola]QIK62317.1 hypothetical protein G7068_03180 [Leucobacter viscericola]